MNCPHCQTDLKYKERSGCKCSNCFKEFAFDPKTHQLLLSDKLFSKITSKLGDNNKLHFTRQQLQFAVSRKKIKTSVSALFMIIPAVITTFVAAFLFVSAAPFVAVAWVILIVAAFIYSKNRVLMPQTIDEFNLSVLARWRSVYGKLPPNLIDKKSLLSPLTNNLKGILICETVDSAVCLQANHVAENLKLAIFGEWSANEKNRVINLVNTYDDLPVYILHDASVEGLQFSQQIKRELINQAKVKDIGLRPQMIMKSKFMQFRHTGTKAESVDDIDNLTTEERDWLKKGFHTPLFVMSPKQLIAYVSAKTKNNFVEPETVSKQKAEAVGFMTWLNE